VAGAPPVCDLDHERRAIDALLESIEGGFVSSAHDCSDGGLAGALAECCMANERSQLGDDAEIKIDGISERGGLFGETQGRYIISSSAPAQIERICKQHAVPVTRIGTVTERDSGFTLRAGSRTIRANVEELARAWHDAIPSIMSAPAVAEEPEALLTVF